MSGLQLVTFPNHCFRFIIQVVLDWTSLIWIGLLIIVFEFAIFLVIRLKGYFIPLRFMIALAILTAILCIEGLPAFFAQLPNC